MSIDLPGNSDRPGIFACPAGKACRIVVLDGKIAYEECVRDTGSRWIKDRPCPNAVTFGGQYFCRRFRENPVPTVAG